ncbi:hypothetical protein A6E05_10120 [Aliivibrio sp. 1S165]|uniref:O-antigen polymerase n=1 Tax=unclassified Aliivibrio TaxID=2645654 RepID=UPI00080E0CF3|nr:MULTISPECIES: O-antigen polymerase [unclassified Aliivibrio]OCH11920.1 hypothetical protein A6E05_10120 [Aliivibrio sp. 1S165]OCH35846.1 hypothetical protein A6E06_10850 [Aliivibrio sp. 1S175]
MLVFLKEKWKFIFPILLVEMYLIFTVLLLFFGPLDWNISNSIKLSSYLFMYHFSFVFGYVFFLYKKKDQNKPKSTFYVDGFIIDNYKYILIFSFLGSVISYKNMTFGESLIPSSFFTDLYIGLVEPAKARIIYAKNILNMENFGNPYISAFLLLLSPFKYILLPSIVYFWPKLKTRYKVSGLFISLIPLLGGVVSSISAINFSYFFIIVVTLLVIVFQQSNIRNVKRELMSRRTIICFLIFIFTFSLYQFYAVKSGANLYQLTVEDTSVERFDYLGDKGVLFKNNDERTVLYDFYEKITVYLVQGYKGMSISLDYPFDSTYGAGHSIFLQRVFEDYLGFNVREHTYQRKITSLWNENVYWHSAYSYFANDFSFKGVVVVMFLLGYLFALLIYKIINFNDIFSKLLLPLFAIMILYLPANNQVFSFLEYMIPFWFLLFMIIISAYVYKKYKIQIVSEKIC